jgi:hypothetical protein
LTLTFTKTPETIHYEQVSSLLRLKLFQVYCLVHGRAIAEAVSLWLPAAATRVRALVWQVGFVMDKVASGQVFSE